MLCPAGHESTSTDYCDTCGVAMDAAAAAAAPVDAGAPDAAPADAAPVAAGACPNCQASNPANALFCENCGYDFTTGSLPRPVESLTPPTGAPTPTSSLDLGAPSNPSPAPADSWVAEIWIDPDWYADQESTDPLPSPGLPVVTPLQHTSVLIGRASRSRGISPDLDLESDNGISRRHAQLTTDGTRWFVEDLGSSNGTYVGGGAGMLPKTPITPGQKVEITGDDRIYLGAWTRIVIRKAAPGEV